MIAKASIDSETIQLSNQAFLPDVSVVVPIYNGEHDLPDLISCLYAQTYPHEKVEFLLVDNRSKDRTAEIIKSSIEEAKKKGLKFQYVAETDIQCVSAARNAGIRASSNEIIAITDVDCRPDPDWLYELVQPFVDPAVGVVGGAVIAFPGKTLFENFAKRKRILSHRSPHSYDPPFALGANHAVRRKAFEQVGLYRPYLSGCDDIDMCWRIQKDDLWQFFSAEKAIVQHRHRDNLRDLFKQWRSYGRGYQYLYELYDIDLLDRVDWQLYRQRLILWTFKEFPKKSLKILLRKASFLDLFETPLVLVTWSARAMGQSEAKLTPQMREIDRL